MKRLRTIGSALIAVFAMSAIVASAASAHNFKAETPTVKVKASTTFSAAEHLQGFQASNAISVCKKGTFEGNGTSGAETLEVHPVYTECSVALAGTNTAEVVTTGCNYLFHAKEPSKAEPKAVDVKCETGKEVKVKIPNLACEIDIPAQTELGTIEYVNQGAGAARKVLVKANVTGIKYKSNCAAVTVKEGATAEYREGEVVAGVPKMGTGPAQALSEGLNPETLEPDGVWVE